MPMLHKIWLQCPNDANVVIFEAGDKVGTALCYQCYEETDPRDWVRYEVLTGPARPCVNVQDEAAPHEYD